MTLTELVARAKAGDRAAADELARLSRQLVYTTAYRVVKNPHDADTITQEAMLLAFTRLHQLGEPQAYLYWVRKITVRQCHHFLERSRPRWMQVDEDMDVPQDADPATEAIRRETVERVHQGVEQLGTTDSRTLGEYYFSGRTVKEMAQGENAPVGTIKRRLHDARRRLANILD